MKNLRVAISNVMETMFFEPVQIIEKDMTLQEWFPDGSSIIGATLGFSGPLTGSFYLLVPVTATDKIVANFLGIDGGEIDDEQRMDTVKEALNMIGGGSFSLFDKDGEFKLSIPELMSKEKCAYDQLGHIKGDTVFLESTDNRLAAGVGIED
jgi:CheY-specific phosphatase CheX